LDAAHIAAERILAALAAAIARLPA